ncbi:hypothetical protein D3C80_1712910 [compost metagenome]
MNEGEILPVAHIQLTNNRLLCSREGRRILGGKTPLPGWTEAKARIKINYAVIGEQIHQLTAAAVLCHHFLH